MSTMWLWSVPFLEIKKVRQWLSISPIHTHITSSFSVCLGPTGFTKNPKPEILMPQTLRSWEGKGQPVGLLDILTLWTAVLSTHHCCGTWHFVLLSFPWTSSAAGWPWAVSSRAVGWTGYSSWRPCDAMEAPAPRMDPTFAKSGSGCFDFVKRILFPTFSNSKTAHFRIIWPFFSIQNYISCLSSNGMAPPGLPDPDLTCYTLLLDVSSWTFPLELLAVAQRRGGKPRTFETHQDLTALQKYHKIPNIAVFFLAWCAPWSI